MPESVAEYLLIYNSQLIIIITVVVLASCEQIPQSHDSWFSRSFAWMQPSGSFRHNPLKLWILAGPNGAWDKRGGGISEPNNLGSALWMRKVVQAFVIQESEPRTGKAVFFFIPDDDQDLREKATPCDKSQPNCTPTNSHKHRVRLRFNLTSWVGWKWTFTVCTVQEVHFRNGERHCKKY